MSKKMVFRRREIIGLIGVAFIFILLLGKYFPSSEVTPIVNDTSHRINKAWDNAFGTCPAGQMRINITGGYVCREEVEHSLWVEIYDTYPASGGGKEIAYDFLDEGNVSIANQYLENMPYVDRYKPVKIEPAIAWEADPYDEQYWRFIYYSLRPTRHLLYAGRVTENSTYNEKLIEVTEDFIDNGMDKNSSWEDNHAVAFRTMVLTNTWWKLREEKALSVNLSTKILKALEVHGEYLMEDEHYEGWYNHGISESGALLVLSTSFPDMPGSENMSAIAKKRLDEGINSLVDENGLLVENSPYYQFYATQNYWQIYEYSRKHNITIGENFGKKVEAMISYDAFILQPNSEVPLIGASLNRTVNMNGAFREMAELDKEFAYVLTKGEEGTMPKVLNKYYLESGQTIMRSGWGNETPYEDETQLIFDVGPYRTTHSDLDALSFSLYSNGQTLVTDSGLYTYEAGAYKSYFHGTSAHNTVLVDGKDQATGTTVAGNFFEGKGYAYQSAQHNLYPGVTHQRSVMLLGHDLVLIVDNMVSEKDHKYSQIFHIFPGADLKIDGLDIIAKGSDSNKSIKIHQFATEGIALNKLLGQEHPPKGICSYEYEKSVPCHYISYEQYGKNATYVTLLEIGNVSRNISGEVNASGGILEIESPEGNYTINLSVPGIPKLVMPDYQKRSYTLLADEKIYLACRSTMEFENLSISTSENPEGQLRITGIESDYGLPELRLEIAGVREYYPGKGVIDTGISCRESKEFRIYEQEDFLPIFGYHNVLKDNETIVDPTLEIHLSDFERQVEYATNTLGCKWYTFGDIMENYVLVGKKTPRGACVMTFDDGRANHYDNAYPVIQKYNVKATFYIITGLVDRPKYMTWAQLRQLYENGHEIGSHTINHMGLVKDAHNDSEVTYQVEEARYALESKDFFISTFAYPRGEWNQSVVDIVDGSGYSSARDTSKDNIWRDRRALTASMDDNYIWHMYYHKPEMQTIEEMGKSMGYTTWWQFEEGSKIIQKNEEYAAIITSVKPANSSYATVYLRDGGDSVANKFIVSTDANYTLEIIGSKRYGIEESEFKVYIDNVSRKFTELNSSCTNAKGEYFCSFFVNASLSEGPHEIKIENNKGVTYMDKFRVFRTLTKQSSYGVKVYAASAPKVEPKEPPKQITMEVGIRLSEEKGIIEKAWEYLTGLFS